MSTDFNLIEVPSCFEACSDQDLINKLRYKICKNDNKTLKPLCKRHFNSCTQEYNSLKQNVLNDKELLINYETCTITVISPETSIVKSTDLIRELKKELKKKMKLQNSKVSKPCPPKRTTSIQSETPNNLLDSIIDQLLVKMPIFDGKSLYNYIHHLINDIKAVNIKNIINDLLTDINNNNANNNQNKQEINETYTIINKENSSIHSSDSELTNSMDISNSNSCLSIPDKIQFNPVSPAKLSNISAEFYANYMKIGNCYKVLLLLRPYDEIIRSYCLSNDHRLIQIAKTYNVKIHFFGPYKSTKDDTKTIYHCLISSLIMSNLEKCIKTIKSTFPNTHPRILEIVKY